MQNAPTDNPPPFRNRVRRLLQTAIARDSRVASLDDYRRVYDEASASEQRSSETHVPYDFTTDCFEWGWGESFHFAPRRAGESRTEAITRYEHYLALRLGLRAGQRVLDVGCGIGGPMRSIARISGADIFGVNNHKYQIRRGEDLVRRNGLESECHFVEADFTSMPFGRSEFDAAYVIEAACHARDRRQVFGEVFRVLKPGSLFAGYEWCLTDQYDPHHPEHARIKHGIEEGNDLPPLVSTHEVKRALHDVGFMTLDAHDRASNADAATPWYSPLAASLSPVGVLHSRLGAAVTHGIAVALETTRIGPRGTARTHAMLRLAQRSMLAGGQYGLFTPMFFFLARKPQAPFRG